MALQEQELLIVKLARMLDNRQLTSNTVNKIFSFICDEFAFDCAFMYEADWNENLLHLTESVGLSEQMEYVPKSFLPDLTEGLEKGTVLYCDRQLQITPKQLQIISMFEAESAAILFLADENERVYSVLILCSFVSRPPLQRDSLDNLKTALNILSNNVTIRMYQNRLQFAQTALEGIMDNTGIDIYANDFYTHDILYVNESMAKPYGGKAKFEGRKCWQILFPGQTGPCDFCPQKKLLDESGKPTKVYTWDYQRAFDGSWFRVFSAAFRWADGRLAHVVSSADITESKRNEEKIRYMANYDSLTNLPNRRKLVAECESRIAGKLDKLWYLLFFDIDGFKNINDSLGHDAGDEFLIELGKFFTGIPMLKAAIYRNGGDEFVAMLGEGITKDNVCDLSRFIQERFKSPWKLQNGTVFCGISIGVAQYPDDGDTAEELLRKADKAMYKVKNSGGGSLYFANDCK